MSYAYLTHTLRIPYAYLTHTLRIPYAGGRVYAFGGNACGQLGLGSARVGIAVNTPRLIKALQMRMV
eukprot:5753542-Pyramimonas_sp.AAC.1